MASGKIASQRNSIRQKHIGIGQEIGLKGPGSIIKWYEVVGTEPRGQENVLYLQGIADGCRCRMLASDIAREIREGTAEMREVEICETGIARVS